MYPEIFRIPLITFLTYYRYNNCHVSTREWNNYLVILQDTISLEKIKSPYLIKDSIGKDIVSCFNRLDNNSFSPLPKLKNLSSLFDMTNNLSYVSNLENIYLLVDLAIKRNYLEFLNLIYNGKYKLLFEKWIEANNQDKVSIINSSLFVISDLNLFIEGIRDKGYNINGGPQRYRSQMSSLKSFLASVDIDFRESLYNHNNYHVMYGNLYENYSLSREKFSYKNIHMNISNKNLKT